MKHTLRDPIQFQGKQQQRTWERWVSLNEASSKQGATPTLAKLVPGVNDLATLYPEVAKEADGWDPSGVTSKSGKKLQWRCAKRHIWEATVLNRTFNESGCPYCSGQRAIAGVNDLATLFPKVAEQADGWDPGTVKPGSGVKLPWLCSQGHTWTAIVASRTRPESKHCPICIGRTVLAGFNDLATVLPELAAQADGWDPSTVTRGSNAKVGRVCQKGHKWLAVVHSRANSRGCPFCSRHQVVQGVTDLSSLWPEVAKQADGWDPQTVSAQSSKKLPWLCSKGHTWSAIVASRTRPESRDCPICIGRKVLPGFNDLATVFPDIASQAHGWDPKTITAGSKKRALWRCDAGHTWQASVGDRTPPRNSGCPFCSGREALVGFNDLATVFPDLAAEVVRGDPKTVTAKSNKTFLWRCREGHQWEAAVQNRTPPASTGCPECSDRGFKASQPAWFYLLERPGEQQIGITNRKEVRLQEHAPYGWHELEVVGPFPGNQVLALEKKLKQWLKREVGLVPGTHENWFTASLEVQSLAELKARSGVETNLF